MPGILIFIHAISLFYIEGSGTEDHKRGKVVGLVTETGRTGVKAKVKFIELYDTVASYGIDITNDTRQLHLNSIQQADKVVQLAASDEHRIKFPLTNINSAGSKGIEKFLPGVHSDIGGGYHNNVPEKERLIKKGWYKKRDLKVVKIQNNLIANRTVSNEYSRIPLHMVQPLMPGTRKPLLLKSDVDIYIFQLIMVQLLLNPDLQIMIK